MPFFTHDKLVKWINNAGTTLGFTVKSAKRHITHGKIFQIDSMWFKDQQLVAFVEAERRLGNESHHRAPHLLYRLCVARGRSTLLLLVFLENESDHCTRLCHTWKWLTRLLPPVLKTKGLPIYIKRNETRSGLHSATITHTKFTQQIQEMIR